jgi:hypothetical protein
VLGASGAADEVAGASTLVVTGSAWGVEVVVGAGGGGGASVVVVGAGFGVLVVVGAGGGDVSTEGVSTEGVCTEGVSTTVG